MHELLFTIPKVIAKNEAAMGPKTYDVMLRDPYFLYRTAAVCRDCAVAHNDFALTDLYAHNPTSTSGGGGGGGRGGGSGGRPATAGARPSSARPRPGFGEGWRVGAPALDGGQQHRRRSGKKEEERRGGLHPPRPARSSRADDGVRFSAAEAAFLADVLVGETQRG